MLTQQEATKAFKKLRVGGVHRLQEILREKDAKTNVEKWLLGEKLERFADHAGSRVAASKLLQYYGLPITLQESCKLLYRRIPLIMLESYENQGEKAGWPVTWSLLRAAIDCRYANDCYALLDLAIAERLNGNQARKYADLRGLYAHRAESRKQASMRVMEREAERFLNALRSSNDRIADIQENMTAPERKTRSTVVDMLEHVEINIAEERERLVTAR